MASLTRLREIFESAKQVSRRKPKKLKSDATNTGDADKPVEVKIGDGVLNTWAKEFSGKYELIKDAPDLVSRSGDGRAKFCSATLRDILKVLEQLSAGQTVDAVQPLLRIPNKESKEQAMNRFLGDIKHGLVTTSARSFLAPNARTYRQARQAEFCSG